MHPQQKIIERQPIYTILLEPYCNISSCLKTQRHTEIRCTFGARMSGFIIIEYEVIVKYILLCKKYPVCAKLLQNNFVLKIKVYSKILQR